MRNFLLSIILCVGVLFAQNPVAPGEVTLRAKAGPSFNLQDWENQFKLGGEFDYELGYGLGITFLSLFGINDEFRFQMIPGFRFDYLYAGPASFYGVVGLGYGRMSSENTMDMRAGTGITLPIGEKYEINSDANFFISPVGTPGTPVTFEWLLAFGYKFK